MFDGEPLQNSHKERKGVFTPEGKTVVDEIRTSLDPEVARIEKYLGNRADAEKFLVLSCIRRIDESKSILKNYTFSDIFMALALGTLLQSENPEYSAKLLYERKGGDYGDPTHYDVLDISSSVNGRSSHMIVPLLDKLFKRTLVEKLKVTNYEPDFEHNRQFTKNAGKIDQGGENAIDEILRLYDALDLEAVLSNTYGDKYISSPKWLSLKEDISSYKRGNITKEDFYVKQNLNSEEIDA